MKGLLKTSSCVEKDVLFSPIMKLKALLRLLRFPEIVALKANDSYCWFLSREKGIGDEASSK